MENQGRADFHSILALDCATATGWALWSTGMQKPRAGTVKMPSCHGSMGEFAEVFMGWLVPFAQLNKVTHVVVEAPFIAMHPGAKTNMFEVRKLVSLVSFSEYAARQVGATCTETVRSTVLKHFIARGSGLKRVDAKRFCIAACQMKGWNINDEDMADACATLDHYLCVAEIPGVPWDCKPATWPVLLAAVEEAAAKNLAERREKKANEGFVHA